MSRGLALHPAQLKWVQNQFSLAMGALYLLWTDSEASLHPSDPPMVAEAVWVPVHGGLALEVRYASHRMQTSWETFAEVVRVLVVRDPDHVSSVPMP